MLDDRPARCAAQLRDGSVVPQNREALQAQDMAVTGAGPILAKHEQVNQQWIQYDISLRFARRVKRVYPVLNLLSAPVTTHAASVSSTDFVNHLAD